MTGKRRRGLSYKEAGVDIGAGDRAVELISAHAKTTFRPEVIGDLGGFAGAFSAQFKTLDDPVLISAADGVGTKLVIAQQLDRHDTVGIDLVAMIVDDIACAGAEPLFLLDYIACGRLVPERIERIVAGIAEGCRQAGCALLGGETAEHPGTMDADAYDLAAFGVGVAERGRMWGTSHVKKGDLVIGLASTGLHSNGYSLVRAIILNHDLDLATVPKGWTRSIGDELLEPTRIYARALLSLETEVHAAAHITGGGIEGNVVRVLPRTMRAVLRRDSWPEPPIFEFLRSAGELAEGEMSRTFNLGLGMTLIVAPEDSAATIEQLGNHGCPAFEIGEIVMGNKGVVIE
ncbi:MAG: phosphoribosylformylglycinamidine cyclo-ligase [Actinomycetota bacterium]|nr:phosphoribosylformylglycinamidine cyclo-ligase [Actinomycetota bacterium]